jgi:hypothetical protein
MASTKPSYPTLEERVQEVLSTYEIKEASLGLYTVKSPKGDTYTVDPNGGTCNCPAGQKGKLCKHLQAVRVLLSKKEERHEMEPREAMRILDWVVKQSPERLLELSPKQEAKVYKALATILVYCYNYVTKQELQKLLE